MRVTFCDIHYSLVIAVYLSNTNGGRQYSIHSLTK